MILRTLTVPALCALQAIFVGVLGAQQIPLGATDFSVTGPTPTTSIYYDVSINTYQALTTSLGFSDKDNTQKLNVAPFKLQSDLRKCAWYCDATLNVTQKTGVYTFGVGWAYNSAAPYSPRNSRVADKITQQYAVDVASGKVPRARDQLPGESDADYDTYVKEYRTAAVRRLYTDYWRSLINNSWEVKVTGNVLTFGVLTGTQVDLNADGRIDNAHRVKGWDVGLGGSFTPSMRSGISGSLHLSRKRASSIEEEPLARYYGGSLTAAYRVATLDPNYQTSDAYKKKLFIPSVFLGATVDYQRCTSDVEDCEGNIERQIVFTPYVDLKVTPEAQFRLGLPFRRNRVAAGDETVASPTFQLGFQLSGL